ncbi:glycosyltransferase [Cobetia sp. 29-18-1]|uniref:glycosyltransferase family 4 protein n=2 Tax=Cobetia TaxID=204286 RepID=UPI0024479288|nr:glycosyltransferase [Cobetia sp. 29-18-1]MDH2299196.1 glycosyltransferase [Cobetia sp. 29-18-1]
MDDLLKLATHLAEHDDTPLAFPIPGRVAYVVSHGQSYASNGYAIRTQGIAQALNAQGCEVLCLVRPGRPWELNGQADITPEVTIEGVRYIHSQWPAGIVPKDERAHLEASVERFIELFRVYRPQSVLAGSNWVVGLPAWIAAKRLGLPFYNEVRGFWELSREAREPSYTNSPAYTAEYQRDCFVARQAHKVFTLNEPMKHELSKRDVAPARVHIIPNGVSELPLVMSADPSLKQQLGIQEDDKVVGYVGSFSAYEGLDVLLDACAELVQKGEKLKLLLVGDDQPVTQASQHLANLVDEPWLIQIGRVLHEQVANYYPLLHAVVIPRKNLPVCELVPPMKAAEALAYGKRLVVSDVAPLVEYADKFDGVVSFAAGNATSLATALQVSLKLPAPKPSTELLFSAHTGPMVQALKGEVEKQGGKSEPVAKPAPKEPTKPVDAKPTSPAVQLPFSDNLNVDFCLMSEEVKKKKTPWTHVNVDGVKKISIRAESKPKIADKKVILRVRCFNREGQEVDPVKGAAYFSEAYKWFRYVTVFEQGEDSSQNSVDIPVSDAIASVGLSFVNLGDVKTDSFKASLEKDVKVISDEVDAKKRHEDIFGYLHSAPAKKALQAKAVIYGDVSPNVLDGSSIWLTSVTNIVSSTRPTVLLLKDNVKVPKVVSNIERHDDLTVIEPRDIGFNAPLDQQAAAEALSLIHAHCSQVTALITRGVDLGYEIQKRKEFTGIFYPYLTDFYEVTEQGFSLVEAKVEKLKEIVLNARSVLFQTDEIQKKIEDIVGYEVDGAKLPPSIPDNLVKISESDEENKAGVIHIGYAGKVQPRWGVEELIEEVERQVALGRNIKLHIATGKIHGRGKEGTAFVQRIRRLLEKEFVQLHDSLSREAAISLMAKMDLVWCYRDPQLENSTLELSTKLVETAALGKPCVVYGSDINKQFLGEDYPFVVYEPSEISHLIENFEFLAEKSKDILQGLASKVGKEFTFSSLRKSISTKLDEDNESSLAGKKIVISGHDRKFIYSYITHLRRHGAEVAIDPWEWGAHVSLRLSEHYSSWGDYIFCEWGLANAVWLKWTPEFGPGAKL